MSFGVTNNYVDEKLLVVMELNIIILRMTLFWEAILLYFCLIFYLIMINIFLSFLVYKENKESIL
jgi:hypothetical protein